LDPHRWTKIAHHAGVSRGGDNRFEGLTRRGVDEVSYRNGHRYLSVVADYDCEGRVVWAKPGQSAANLATFFDLLGP